MLYNESINSTRTKTSKSNRLESRLEQEYYLERFV